MRNVLLPSKLIISCSTFDIRTRWGFDERSCPVHSASESASGSLSPNRLYSEVCSWTDAFLSESDCDIETDPDFDSGKKNTCITQAIMGARPEPPDGDNDAELDSPGPICPCFSHGKRPFRPVAAGACPFRLKRNFLSIFGVIFAAPPAKCVCGVISNQ